MNTVLVLASLLFAPVDDAHVFPFAPTTSTPVEVHYRSSCTARTHSVVREGSEITITAIDPQCPAVLPIPVVEKVRLPELLPAGLYHVTIQESRQPFFLTAMWFAVRHGGPKPFELHPSAMYSGDQLPVRMSGVRCEQADCSGVTVRVGGEPVAITVAEDGAIWFTAPDHEPGMADVTVQQGSSVMTSPAALYYYWDDRDFAAYTPILFPVILHAQGAFGSQWRSEATVSNPAPWTVYAEYTLHNLGPCIGPCDPPFGPKSLEKFHNGYPQGTVMWAPRSEAEQLALSLRIRDVSRQEQGYGTEIPVVRERDFFHGENIRLLDVPLDPRYRVKVRIYMIEPVLAPALNGAVRWRSGDMVLHAPFTFTRRPSAFVIAPWYAEVDLPAGTAGERVNLEVLMPLDAIGWAFATVTNNETQQVTIVAP